MSTSTPETLYQEIEQDLWKWINEFVTQPNEFYNYKFAPCPYAKGAVVNKTVDVKVYRTGDVKAFIRQQTIDMRDDKKIGTRVMGFPPRVEFLFGINDFVEALNLEFVKDNVFLNTGIMKTSVSRYPGSGKKPYFMVVANSLGPVLDGSEQLQRTAYYKDWPREHYEIVVERRAKMAKQFGPK